MQRGRKLAACLFVFFTFAAAGCTAPVVTRTTGFAKAAAPALVETGDAYALVQTVHAGTVMAERVAAWDTTSIRKPPPSGAFGTPEDLKVRSDVLKLLGTYVTLLAEVSGDTQAKAADTASKASAAALGQLATDGLPLLANGSTATVSPSDTTSDTSGAATAIDALSRMVMERHRRRALPGILRQADGPVQTLCSLLERDFGASPATGLRHVVRTDYEAWLGEEDAAIRDHLSGYSYPEKRAAVEALFTLQAHEAADDTALAEADAALADLARAHHALASTANDKNAPAFRTQLGQLIVAAQQLATLETKGAVTK